MWQYSSALIKILSADTTHNYFVYHNSNEPELMELIKSFPNLTLVTDNGMKSHEPWVKRQFVRVVNKAGRVLRFGNIIDIPAITDLICKRYQIDIIHCPVQFIPKTSKAKLVTTMHDVQELHFPEYFSAEERAYRATGYLDFLRRADAVVVSYDHVKKDLIKFFNVDRDKISVILLDMQKLWFEKFNEHDISDTVSLHVPSKFILYPAATWKHKNHLRLLEAILYAKNHESTTINLVCTGHKNEHYGEIETFIKNNGLESHVTFKGIVDEKTLFGLYKTCRSVVVPTLYEAGSFPLMESILIGAPVICSNVTSLPETIGSGEFIFDPADIKQMALMLVRMWKDDSFKADNIELVKQRAIFIRNTNSLNKFLNLYASLEQEH